MTDVPTPDRPAARAPHARIACTVLAGVAVVVLAVAAALVGWNLWSRAQPSPEDLVAAARGGDLARVRECLAAGVPVDARPENPWPVGGHGDSALIAAAGTSRADVVAALLDAGADVNLAGPTIDSAIRRAAVHGTPAVMELLLARGADPNLVAARHSMPALHAAAISNRPDAVRTLLDHGADPALAMPGGFRAIHLALDVRSVEVARVLVSKEAERDVFVAAALGPAERLATLVREHPEWLTESPPPMSDTPLLHLAARCGNAGSVAVLLDAGADPNFVTGRRGPWRDSALHYAAREGHLDVARLLLDRGAQVDRNVAGGAPLVGAASAGHVGIVRLLIDRGADVNASQQPNRPDSGTALHFAAATGRADVVELLLARGADASARSRGETALEWALRRTDADVIRLLRAAK